MGKKGGGSSTDPRVGEAAIRNAELGEDYLDWMKGQAAISNDWADYDRTRYQTVFEPLQDDFIAEAQGYDTKSRRSERASQAVGDVRKNVAMANDANRRSMARMGVDPRSGRAKEINATMKLREGLAASNAENVSRRQVEAEGRALRAQSVNLGSGFAVNPATSLGMASGAVSNGFSGAMQGNSQMASILNQQQQQKNASTNSLWGGLGGLAGMGLSILSSEKVKEDKKPARGVLDALNKMPVEEWTYKEGYADEGRHIGPYAEDFHAATGKGDGKSIPVTDAIGVTMGAVQELSQKVDEVVSKLASRGVMEATA